MKSLILSSLSAAVILSFTACTTVKTNPAPADPTIKTTTTTTENNTVVRPSGTTVTRTTRSY